MSAAGASTDAGERLRNALAEGARGNASSRPLFHSTTCCASTRRNTLPPGKSSPTRYNRAPWAALIRAFDRPLSTANVACRVSDSALGRSALGAASPNTVATAAVFKGAGAVGIGTATGSGRRCALRNAHSCQARNAAQTNGSAHSPNSKKNLTGGSSDTPTGLANARAPRHASQHAVTAQLVQNHRANVHRYQHCQRGAGPDVQHEKTVRQRHIAQRLR